MRDTALIWFAWSGGGGDYSDPILPLGVLLALGALVLVAAVVALCKRKMKSISEE